MKAGMPSTLTGVYYTNGSDYAKGASKTVELTEGADPTGAFSMVSHIAIAIVSASLVF